MAVRLRLRRLPFTARENHVREFFRGFQLADKHPAGAVDFLKTYDQKPTGQCFVYFNDEREAMRAKDLLHDTLWVKTASQAVGRVDVLEDWTIGKRSIVKEEYVPGDIEDEGLKDKARESMLKNEYRDREERAKMTKDMW